MKTPNSTAWPLPGATVLLFLLAVSIAAPTGQAAVQYQLLKSFSDSIVNPASPLIQGSDGALYGTGLAGIFRINRDGTGYAILHLFSPSNDFCDPYPAGPLFEGSDGLLYGATRYLNLAGPPCPGDSVIFRLAKDGTGFLILHTFDTEVEEEDPQGGLIEGSDGALYGVTRCGGANGLGTVFRLNNDGSNYTVLHHFGTIPADGAGPGAGLLKGSDGALYGTTSAGGAYTNQPHPYGLGSVFRLNQDGSAFAVIHSFGDMDIGWGPQSRLAEGNDGALYGVTPYSGPYAETGPLGSGTVFKLKKDGTGYQVLHQFGAAGDGINPRGLIQGLDGRFYGTTESTGTNGPGIVFRLNNDGMAYSVLFIFGIDTGQLVGVWPRAALLQDGDGAFYGTTVNGGGIGGSNGGGLGGEGTVFKLWPTETPDMIGVTTTSNGVLVSVAGVSAARYQLLRSTDLVTWTTLDTATMPVTGLYNFPDNMPPNLAVFYRVAWVP